MSIFSNVRGAVYLKNGGKNPDHASNEAFAAELTNHRIDGVELTPGMVATIPARSARLPQSLSPDDHRTVMKATCNVTRSDGPNDGANIRRPIGHVVTDRD